MGGFLGIGNSSAKTDRANQLAGVNAAWNVYNTGLPLGQNLSKAGQSTQQLGLSGLQGAQQYWKNLMSGNQAAVGQATLPVSTAINQQADAQRRQQAETGTARGGGVASSNQQAETQRQQQYNTTVAGVQPQAAAGVTQTSQAEANIGQQQLQDALSSLGLSQDVANEIINSSIQSRPISIKANEAVQQQWSNLMGALGL